MGCHHNALSFEKVISFVEESESLEELDLSWSVVIKGSWSNFIKVLGENRTLRNLQIGFNQILEDQSWRLTSAQEAEGLTEVPLNPKNEEIFANL